MYDKIDEQLKAIKRSEVKSDSTTILLRIETETGKEEVCNCPYGSPIYYHLLKLLSPEIYILSNVVCGNKYFIM